MFVCCIFCLVVFCKKIFNEILCVLTNTCFADCFIAPGKIVVVFQGKSLNWFFSFIAEFVSRGSGFMRLALNFL